jgi:two-component system, chemotaxis family, protein-glutamate methylesterase/glutaminase
VKSLIRVLVVDDSAFARKTIKQMLSRSPFIEVVGIAGDGEEAIEKARALNPDVVTLDLMMPGLDGLGFLARQMAEHPLPVIVVTTASGYEDLVLKALEAGAIDFLHKPSMLATETLFEMSDELIEKVKGAAAIQVKRFDPATWEGRGVTPHPLRGTGSVDGIVIGISTGGPQGLKYLIPQFPENFAVPIAVVLHIPVGYTEMYAMKLDEISGLHVSEAKEGDPFRAGLVLIAPAGRHLTFRRNHDGSVVAHLDVKPADTLHRPSVDVLFESAAETFGERTLGVVMTGMGSDGRRGASAIKNQGGRIFTEAEETCVVYGMPATVVEAGLSDRAIPLDRLAAEIMELG